MNRIARSVCLAAALAGWAVAAEAPTTTSALNSIERRYNRPQTMQLLFEQTYTYPGRPPRTERGTLYLRKPRRMRWAYEEPPGKLFLSDGKSIYFYTPSSNRVEVSPLRESPDMRAPLAFLMGRVDMSRDFKEFRSRPDGDALRIRALPKSDRAPYTEVEFLAGADGRIRELQVEAIDGGVMQFRFDREEANPRLEEGLFEFRAPAGVEVVDIEEEEAY